MILNSRFHTIYAPNSQQGVNLGARKYRSKGACKVAGGFNPSPSAHTHCLSEIFKNCVMSMSYVILKHPFMTTINQASVLSLTVNFNCNNKIAETTSNDKLLLKLKCHIQHNT